MLNLMIKLSSVVTSMDYEGDKLVTSIKDTGPVWVNADKIVMFTPHHIDDEQWVRGERNYTRVGLGGEDFAYVSEDPETILVLIDKARAELTDGRDLSL